MVALTILSRMRTLHGKMALVRNGTGAAVFPPGVKKLVLTCSRKINDGHMGPRKFWRIYMPRLKYHNPNVQMDVSRPQLKGGPATLTLEFEDGRTEVVDVQHKHENEIIRAVIEKTGARQLPINDEDTRLANEYLEGKRRRKEHEIGVEKKRAAKREQERLERAGTV